MKRRGVCYDVGRVMWGQDWRPEFSAAEAHRELQIIKNDLNCNAVRICGQDIDRLMITGKDALDQGLEVWLSPELWDHNPEDTLTYIADAAERAQELEKLAPGQVVLSVGSELTLFMAGIVKGDSVFQRLEHSSFWEHIRSGTHNGPLNAFLAEANERVRQVFHGSVTYASVPLEAVDWSPFDIVGVDLYRDARLRDRFSDLLGRYVTHERPVAITEFGCCTYRGAAAAGGRGFAIVDYPVSDRSGTLPRLNGDYLRDEAEQTRELTELLTIFDHAGVDATFVMTFVMTFVAPLNPCSDDPRYDLDMASYSLVKSYGARLGPLGAAYPHAPWDRDRLGTTYPEMPWEPKKSFTAVANYYAMHDGGFK
ncbi:hypothetical protein [Frankia sp. Cr1]|uniref:hypothetical protein n=1 Tax=Frankia sp. Cr1 TaxID=3073931 RepID=UPI002AD4ED78|nr:hypothetical protein [Frankia sp. Cr1]